MPISPISDIDFDGLRLTSLHAYLWRAGWRQEVPSSDTLMCWTLDGSAWVTLPRDEDAPGYASLIARAIEQIAAVEQRSASDVLGDAQHAAGLALTVALRGVPPQPPSGLVVASSFALVDAVAHAVFPTPGAPCSSVNPIVPSAPSVDAVAYLHDIFLSTRPVPGGGVTMYLPEADMQAAAAESVADGHAFAVDAVGARLANALRAAAALVASEEREDLEDATAAVGRLGVGAGFLEALARLVGFLGDGEGVEIVLSAVDDSGSVRRLETLPLDGDEDGAALLFAADRLRNPDLGQPFTGIVRALRHPAGALGGEAEIECLLDGRLRRATVPVVDHDLATVAAAQRSASAVIFHARRSDDIGVYGEDAWVPDDDLALVGATGWRVLQ